MPLHFYTRKWLKVQGQRELLALNDAKDNFRLLAVEVIPEIGENPAEDVAHDKGHDQQHQG